MDYAKIQKNVSVKIQKYGRKLQLYKLSDAVSDPLKPWRGTGAPTDTSRVDTYGAFVIGNTSIPTESRGLAFDWVDEELLKISRHVCLVPAYQLPILDDYKTIVDPVNENGRWNIIWGQCLQPGPLRLMYCFGLKQ